MASLVIIKFICNMICPFRQAGAVIETSVSISLADLQELFGVLPTARQALALQLLDAFPVMLLTCRKQAVLVNSCELVMSPDSFERLLMLDTVAQAQQTSTEPESESSTTSTVSQAASRKIMGRPSLVSKFPTIVECTTVFIQQHGYSAHNRRREETGTAGVSLGQIRDHLLQVIPGLRYHGLSKHTIARLMGPPRRGTIAAKQYQGIVKARVPEKRNAYRKNHPD